ncbi:TPA: hypothetical protein DF272_02680 [Candidatus Falkowbacteria bacterium]|nr:hypothetical protein [Candidatus Falkowbacteria bacterium]
MDISILGYQLTFDFDWIYVLGTKPFYELLWFFMVNGGWLLILLVCIWGGFEIFIFNNQNKFAAKQKYVYLALDIPRQNLQSPQAVENVFSTLAGAHMPLEWEEKMFDGAFQLGFSFEIVSFDGFIQYVVRTPVQWRDLVESAVYSQYPDAEITQIEDYTKELSITFPSDEYDLWGSDLVLYNKPYFPIRSYKTFESSLNRDIKDPLTALLEVMNKLGPGEQFWFQILLYPTDNKWTKDGINAIKKMVGQKVEEKKNWMDVVMDEPLKWFNELGTQALGAMGFGDDAAEKKQEDRMIFLPPIEKIQAEGIAEKVSKIGFECKLRIVYVARHEVFNKGKGVSGTFGAIKQFSDLHLNGFKPDKNKTHARWPWFKEYRKQEKQNKVFRAYKKRDSQTASPKYILNIEELATLWHFPYFEIKGPIVKRIESKRVMSPVGLPIEPGLPIKGGEKKTSSARSAAQSKEPVVDYDDNYFENRFAVDKTGEADRQRKQELLTKATSNKANQPATQSKDVEDSSFFFDGHETSVSASDDEDDDNEQQPPRTGGGNVPTNLPV